MLSCPCHWPGYYESGAVMSHFVMPPELVTLFKAVLAMNYISD